MKRRTLLIPARPNKTARFKRPLVNTARANKTERGWLLKLTTKKPRAVSPPPAPEVDIEPPNSISNVKRVVKRPKEPTDLNIQAQPTIKPATCEVGTQIGLPLGEFLKRQNQLINTKATEEPPLQGYWTHKVNLPYPPESAGGQFVQPQFVQQQQQQAASQLAPQQQVALQHQVALQQQQFVPQQQFLQTIDGNFVQVVPSNALPKAYQTHFVNRQQRRNHRKRTRYVNRRGDRSN